MKQLMENWRKYAKKDAELENLEENSEDPLVQDATEWMENLPPEAAQELKGLLKVYNKTGVVPPELEEILPALMKSIASSDLNEAITMTRNVKRMLQALTFAAGLAVAGGAATDSYSQTTSGVELSIKDIKGQAILMDFYTEYAKKLSEQPEQLKIIYKIFKESNSPKAFKQGIARATTATAATALDAGPEIDFEKIEAGARGSNKMTQLSAQGYERIQRFENEKDVELIPIKNINKLFSQMIGEQGKDLGDFDTERYHDWAEGL